MGDRDEWWTEKQSEIGLSDRAIRVAFKLDAISIQITVSATL